MKKRVNQIGSIILVILLALALIGVLAPFVGYRFDVVRSGSMTPQIGVGDLVVSAPVSTSNIAVGDIIEYKSPENGLLICHRVVSVDEQNSTLVTKGDANGSPDPYNIPFNNVVGKVAFSMPVLGYVFDFLKSPYGWVLIIIIAILILFFGKEERPKKNKTDIQPKEDYR